MLKMAIYDPNSNQHSDGSDTEVSLNNEKCKLNCLEFALDFWNEDSRYKIYYNSDHVINLLGKSGADGYLPIEEFGLEHIMSSFTLKPRYLNLLKIYFEIHGL